MALAPSILPTQASVRFYVTVSLPLYPAALPLLSVIMLSSLSIAGGEAASADAADYQPSPTKTLLADMEQRVAPEFILEAFADPTSVPDIVRGKRCRLLLHSLSLSFLAVLYSLPARAIK